MGGYSAVPPTHCCMALQEHHHLRLGDVGVHRPRCSHRSSAAAPCIVGAHIQVEASRVLAGATCSRQCCTDGANEGVDRTASIQDRQVRAGLVRIRQHGTGHSSTRHKGSGPFGANGRTGRLRHFRAQGGSGHGTKARLRAVRCTTQCHVVQYGIEDVCESGVFSGRCTTLHLCCVVSGEKYNTLQSFPPAVSRVAQLMWHVFFTRPPVHIARLSTSSFGG